MARTEESVGAGTAEEASLLALANVAGGEAEPQDVVAATAFDRYSAGTAFQQLWCCRSEHRQRRAVREGEHGQVPHKPRSPVAHRTRRRCRPRCLPVELHETRCRDWCHRSGPAAHATHTESVPRVGPEVARRRRLDAGRHRPHRGRRVRFYESRYCPRHVADLSRIKSGSAGA